MTQRNKKKAVETPTALAEGKNSGLFTTARALGQNPDPQAPSRFVFPAAGAPRPAADQQIESGSVPLARSESAEKNSTLPSHTAQQLSRTPP